jgi:low affinity Fe/Cu permease
MVARKKDGGLGLVLERSASAVTRWTGSTARSRLPAARSIVWALTGPLFNFDDTWQLVIKHRNHHRHIPDGVSDSTDPRTRDSLCAPLKLNEIVAALEGASNRLIDVESLTEHELKVLHGHYARLAADGQAGHQPHAINIG